MSVSNEFRKMVESFIDECALADETNDEAVLNAIAAREEEMVANFTPEESYEYHLRITARMVDQSPEDIDLEIEERIGSKDIAIKDAFLAEFVVLPIQELTQAADRAAKSTDEALTVIDAHRSPFLYKGPTGLQ